MSIYEPTFDELLKAYCGTPDDIRHGDSSYYEVAQDPEDGGYMLLDAQTGDVIFYEPADVSYPKLAQHAGGDCEIVIDAYMSPGADDYYAIDVGKIVNLAITCLDCNEIIYDMDRDFDVPIESVNPFDFM